MARNRSSRLRSTVALLVLGAAELLMAPVTSVAFITFVAFAAGAAGAAAEPRSDFLLHCMGCHRADGSGTPPGIPALRGRIGYYLQIPGGRDYLTQVPGAANAPLSDDRLAAVLNWMIAEFGKESVPTGWQPFSAEEVSRTRGKGPADIDARRHQLWREIEARFPRAGAAY